MQDYSLSGTDYDLRERRFSLREVNKMDRKQMSETEDCWIDEQDLPLRPGLKPIRQFSCLYFDNEEEQQAYWDFVHWFMTQDYALLLSLPKQPQHSDFWAFEGDDSISFHYESIDYQRAHPFDKYAYRLRKIYERVEDLALLHSCICQKEGKENIAKRFKKLVDDEFRNKARMLLENYRKYPQLMNKQKLFGRISELNGRILKCKCIWQKHAYSK
jgi:hypothetical protein